MTDHRSAVAFYSLSVLLTTGNLVAFLSEGRFPGKSFKVFTKTLSNIKYGKADCKNTLFHGGPTQGRTGSRKSIKKNPKKQKPKKTKQTNKQTKTKTKFDGFQPEWCISTIYHCREIPFWSEALD